MPFAGVAIKMVKVVLLVLWLIIWLNVSVFAWLVCQGPDEGYRIDSDYVLWNWPGTLIRLKPGRYNNEQIIEYVDVLQSPRKVIALGVVGDFVVGKTTDGWFAVNRENHRVWHPYSSQAELKAVVGLEFSDSEVKPSRPWSRLIISSHTKIVFPLIILLFGIPLIGLRRLGRILKLPFKRGWRAKKKQIRV